MCVSRMVVTVKRLPTPRALLVPAADSEANISISAAALAERFCLRLCEDPLGSHFKNENDLESKKNQ
ncbi:hypothetical protein TNCV_4512341 [Trichonephila clavipes]|nr:hypothetical protein TNCV_4512341 [Trichonephila clavipes]